LKGHFKAGKDSDERKGENREGRERDERKHPLK